MVNNYSLSDAEITRIAGELLDALNEQRSLSLLTDRIKNFDLAAAYKVSNAVRTARNARGEKNIGRKIGFTNRLIWDEYGVYAPIWGDMYDTTVIGLEAARRHCDFNQFIEPRIEPEIVFKLAKVPHSDMNDENFISCIASVAHGFEIVQSLFPGWLFKAADTVAAFGLHGKLFLGPWSDITPNNQAQWLTELATFKIQLVCNGDVADTGYAANVLDGPLFALRHLCKLIENDPISQPLCAGEIITTGTLTRAFIVEPNQVWQTRITGLALDGIKLETT